MPAAVPPRKNLPLLLLQAREAMMRRFRRVLKRHRITDQQWRVMRSLAESGPMTSSDIARECCMLGPSLTGVLNRMEAAGWVERARSATDQRRVAIRLSASGRSLVARVMPEVEAVYRELETALGAERLAALSVELEAVMAVVSGDG